MIQYVYVYCPTEINLIVLISVRQKAIQKSAMQQTGKLSIGNKILDELSRGCGKHGK